MHFSLIYSCFYEYRLICQSNTGSIISDYEKALRKRILNIEIIYC